MRSVRSSPRTLWMSGQFENPVGILDQELQFYGVEGIVRAENVNIPDVQRPNLDSVSTRIISDHCRQQLESEVPSPWISRNFGIDRYLKTVEIITRYTE